MPPPRFARKLIERGAILRSIFPHTRRYLRSKLWQLRHESLPQLKHHTQSRIYRYVLHRQAQKHLRSNKPGILQHLRRSTKRLLTSSDSSYLKNEARARHQKLSSSSSAEKGQDIEREGNGAMSYSSYADNGGSRVPGARRRKLAGYLKAANELRQTYQDYYAPGLSSRDSAAYEFPDDTADDFTNGGGVIRSGEEEMILFPSYARKHIRRKASDAVSPVWFGT